MGKIIGNVRPNGDYFIRGATGDSASLIFAGGYGASSACVELEKTSDGYKITIICSQGESGLTKPEPGKIGQLEIKLMNYQKKVIISGSGFEIELNKGDENH